MTPRIASIIAAHTASNRLLDLYEVLHASGHKDLAMQVRDAGKAIADVIGKLVVRNREPETHA